VFTFTAPSGRSYSALPFYTQDFSRSQDGSGAEVLSPAGAPYFAVRYAPSELGVHSYAQAFTAPTHAAPLAGNFTAAGGPAVPGDGYAAVRNRKFTLDNATAFFLVGENMAWPGCWPYFNGSCAFDNATGSSFMYDRFLPKLAAVGGNWIRLWVGPSLVRDVAWAGEQGSFLPMALAAKVPFGEYNLEAAWRIEHVVGLCRALGVKISLVLESQQAVSTGQWGFWDAAIYNAANGGPLAGAEGHVFSNGATMAELRQRWLYVLSRWAFSTSIFSWELQNEAEDWPGGFDGGALAAAAEFSALIRANDPYGHLIDNSFGGVAGREGPEHAWEASPDASFTSVHQYNMPDVAAAVWSTVTQHVGALGKPCFLEEFGAKWQGPYQHQVDPAGVGMHTGAWASLVGLAAGTAMQWFWAETDALDTYHRLQGAAALSRALGKQLLAWQWSTWNGAGSGLSDGRASAGWSVAVDPATGAVKGALAYVYNKNYTQYGCGNGCELQVIAGAQFALGGLPSPAPGAQPRAQLINTSSGEPLDWQPARAGGRPRAPPAEGAGELFSLQLPPFSRDVALWVEWV
jgi:hypothetical protein